MRLPGVHSDIGGSYEEKKTEVRRVPEADRARLLAEGWYTDMEGELVPAERGWYRGTRLLTHHYQFLPLAAMVDQAQQSGVTFTSFDEDKNKDYRVPAILQPLAEEMKAFVRGRPGPVSEQPYVPAPFVLPDAFAWVRNQYLHRSAVKGELSLNAIAMAGRETDGLPDRRHIPDAADVH